MPVAIKIENLSKKYVIGHQKQESYTTLRDVITHRMKGIGQRLRHPLSPNREEVDVEEFWALKDINLEIKQGDRVGIIGRNGAGKSTLLKILSRITDPTSGKIHINGRVASLLEVGTGFHPELSGRENIYLNGAILGMRRDEIKRKFDEIVDFAEVEKFLDTPVKRYSSGMYVRLAFAVAAHLEPEILVVDEVLAVGDAQFQKKCLGKMEEVGKEGRTVLFVSHNLFAVQRLCQHIALLDKGNLCFKGEVEQGLSEYKKLVLDKDGEISTRLDRMGTGEVKLVQFYMTNELDERINVVLSGHRVRFHIDFMASRDVWDVKIGVNIFEQEGYVLANLNSLTAGNDIDVRQGNGSFVCEVKRFPLRKGRYYVDINCMVNDGATLDLVRNASYFDVEDSDYYESGSLGYHGKFLMDYNWMAENK